jgi:hypothetical protein
MMVWCTVKESAHAYSQQAVERHPDIPTFFELTIVSIIRATLSATPSIWFIFFIERH